MIDELNLCAYYMDWGVTEDKEYMLGNVDIIGYADSYAQISSFKGKPFITRNKLNSYEYDYLIIMPKLDIARVIRNELEKEIKNHKLVIFEEIYNYQCLSKINRIQIKDYSGIILGISHAVTGISEIPGFINCAVRSQDIYYNVKTFEKIKDSTCNLKTLIFEMYDYNYLNYDVSMTRRNLETYYSQGGLWEDEHNFRKNQFYNGKSLLEIMQKEVGLNSTCQVRLNPICDNGFETYKYQNVISGEEALPMRKFVSGLVQKRYEDTITNNKKILDDFCCKLREEFGYGIQIIFLFMPRYITMEIALRPHLVEWKAEMMIFLENLEKKYQVKVLDMKNESCISSNRRFYNDVNHLNIIGATAFTDLLVSKIMT